VWLFIDRGYDLYLVNKVLCIVEYLPDGVSKNKFKQMKSCPKSFAYYRMTRMKLATNFKDRFRNAVHYVSTLLFMKKNAFRNNNYKFTTLIAFPFGVLLNIYIRYTRKKGAI
jgi:hypothetical protein